MFNFNKVNFLNEEKFDVFVIEDFLNPAIYNEIRENIPNLKLSEFNERFIINNKLGLQPRDGIYEKNILSNTVLRNLHNEIFNKNFIKKVTNIFWPKILKARKKDLANSINNMPKNYEFKFSSLYQDRRFDKYNGGYDSEGNYNYWFEIFYQYTTFPNIEKSHVDKQKEIAEALSSSTKEGGETFDKGCFRFSELKDGNLVLVIVFGRRK